MRAGQLGLLPRIGKRALKWLSGYDPLGAVWWLPLFWEIGTIVFSNGYRKGSLVPTGSLQILHPEREHPG